MAFSMKKVNTKAGTALKRNTFLHEVSNNKILLLMITPAILYFLIFQYSVNYISACANSCFVQISFTKRFEKHKSRDTPAWWEYPLIIVFKALLILSIFLNTVLRCGDTGHVRNFSTLNCFVKCSSQLCRRILDDLIQTEFFSCR